MGDMVAMPVEGVAFYFADIEEEGKEEKIPCRLFTTGDFCAVTLWHLAILRANLLILNNMTIKGQNGESYSVTGQGQGALNTVLGAIGTYGALTNGGGLLGNLLGGGYNNRPVEVITSEDKPISRYEAKMMQELSAKDSKNSLLESQVYTDQKLTEVTKYLQSEIGAVSAEVRRNKEMQDGINMEQAVYNGTNTAAVACLKGQVAQLQALTELVVPQRRVYDTGCCCNNQ